MVDSDESGDKTKSIDGKHQPDTVNVAIPTTSSTPSNVTNNNASNVENQLSNESTDDRLPLPNTQIPGQFNYHPQQYKSISEDQFDCDDRRMSTDERSASVITNVLTCYKESPPELIENNKKKRNGKKSSDASKTSQPSSDKADFEHAIEMTGYGKFHYLLLAICGLVSTSEEMDVISMSFILPSAQCDLHLNTQTKGWLNSIIFIGMMVGAYVWGSIADTLGRRKVLIVISFMNAVCIVASSFSQNYLLFMIFRFLNGVA